MIRAYRILMTIGLLGALSTSATADVPSFVTYSGRLTDGTAWGKSQVLALTFRIYDQAEAGDPLWEQSFPAVAVEDGHFSVILGEGKNPADNTDLNVTDIFAAHDQTWVTVCIGGGCLPGDEMSPRQAVGSVPYAVLAEVVNKQQIVTDSGKRLALDGIFQATTENALEVASKGSFTPEGKTAGAISFPGATLGYPSTKKACEALLDSSSAHMCTTHEMVISLMLDEVTVKGPYWLADSSFGWGPESMSSSKHTKFLSCYAWRNATHVFQSHYSVGTIYDDTGNISFSGCSSEHPIACCDDSVSQ